MSHALPNRGSNTARTAEDDTLEFSFDPSNSGTPSLRPPKLSEAGLQAAIQLGFNDTYVPSSITGGDLHSSGVDGRGRLHNSNMNSQNRNSNEGGSQNNSSPLFVDNYIAGLTKEQLEGILDPLRRPDSNQIPPDVLAVLLKSSRFDEVVISTQRRLAEMTQNINSQSRGYQQDVNNSGGNIPSSPTGMVHNNATTPAAQSPFSRVQQQSPDKRLTLSPYAKEFVPTSFQSQPDQKESVDLSYAMSQIQFQDTNDSFQGFGDDLEVSDCILSTVTDMISQVSRDPPSLNRCIKSTVDVLKKCLNLEDTLGIIVTLLTEQMISNPNFCYSGAIILEALRNNKIQVGQTDIKKLLLSRMKEEFDHCKEKLAAGEKEFHSRILGVLRLFCELYMNCCILADGSKLAIFGLAALELMWKLLEKDNSVDGIRSVCQLLKLIGREAENSKHTNTVKELDKTFEQLQRLKSKELNPSCLSMIDMILKLRSNQWNHEVKSASPQPSGAGSSSGQTYKEFPQTPVYYELPDSDEDSYDDGTIMIDDEPDEVQAFYEEFLKTTGKSN